MFAEMLGAQAEPAAAIFMALRSGNAQTAAIEAVVALALSPLDAELFGVIQDIVLAANVHRNRFAHWLWAYSDELPDHVLFVDPRAHRAYSIEWALGMASVFENREGPGTGVRLEPADVLAYTVPDMDEAVTLLDRANGLVHLFRVVISKYDPLAGPLRGVLTVQREIVEGLARRQKNQAKPPSTP